MGKSKELKAFPKTVPPRPSSAIEGTGGAGQKGSREDFGFEVGSTRGASADRQSPPGTRGGEYWAT
jgi:hypothetical protein